MFVTKTKAPYLMAIEVYDPLEIIEEPIPPEPPGKFGILPSPSGSFKDNKRNFRTLMPNRDILILGTIPRNVVNLEFLEKKIVSKQYNDNEVITIDKYIKNKKSPVAYESAWFISSGMPAYFSKYKELLA